MDAYKWADDFPKGYGHTNIVYLKRCVGYSDAKDGDLLAACLVVKQCVKKRRIDIIRDWYPDAVLLPVISRNALPFALALFIGLPIHTDVTKQPQKPRKSMSAMERLLNKPIFEGYILPNKDFIIVDDVVTQGGTVAALRQHVISKGGRVVAVVALAYSIGSSIFAPRRFNFVRLFLKFGNKLLYLLKSLGIASDISELTNSQIRYLLRFSCFDNIVKKIVLTSE